MHVMLDIETTGTKPGCAITEIAAVVFDPTLPPKKAANSPLAYHIYVDVKSCHAYGLIDDPATLAWRKEHILSDPPADKVRSLVQALDGLAFWLRTVKEEIPHKRFAQVWAKGASFDFPILEAAYDRTGLLFPFAYWQCTCIRGVLNLAGLKAGASHSAVEDCRYQICALVEAFQILKGVQHEAA